MVPPKGAMKANDVFEDIIATLSQLSLNFTCLSGGAFVMVEIQGFGQVNERRDD
jgi:hypothetical protein